MKNYIIILLTLFTFSLNAQLKSFQIVGGQENQTLIWQGGKTVWVNNSTLVNNNDGTFTYTSENGTVTI